MRPQLSVLRRSCGFEVETTSTFTSRRTSIKTISHRALLRFGEARELKLQRDLNRVSAKQFLFRRLFGYRFDNHHFHFFFNINAI